MKKMLLTVLASFLGAGSVTAHAASASTLYVKDNGKLIDVQEMVNNWDDPQVNYGYENFCYKGDATVVARKMRSWAKDTDYFFSGGGGGFAFDSIRVRRGIAAYDILLVLEDEVAQGEYRQTVIKPCR